MEKTRKKITKQQVNNESKRLQHDYHSKEEITSSPSKNPTSRTRMPAHAMYLRTRPLPTAPVTRQKLLSPAVIPAEEKSAKASDRIFNDENNLQDEATHHEHPPPSYPHAAQVPGQKHRRAVSVIPKKTGTLNVVGSLGCNSTSHHPPSRPPHKTPPTAPRNPPLSLAPKPQEELVDKLLPWQVVVAVMTKRVSRRKND
jgi:hypothetical protein